MQTRTLFLAAILALGASAAYAGDGFKDIMIRDDIKTTSMAAPAPMYEGRSATWMDAPSARNHANSQDPFYFRKANEGNGN